MGGKGKRRGEEQQGQEETLVDGHARRAWEWPLAVPLGGLGVVGAMAAARREIEGQEGRRGRTRRLQWPAKTNDTSRAGCEG
ncbi:unnamed protein product [Urochloa humidicola]